MKFMSVKVVNYEGATHLNYALVNYSDDSSEIELSYRCSNDEGMLQLRKLEKLLRKPAELCINRFDSTISYKELYGRIN